MKRFYVFLVLVVFFPVQAKAAFDGAFVGDMIEYRAKFEDTFVHLAREYNLGFTEMRAANPNVDPWVPGEGTKLVLPTRHILPDAPRDGIVINIPEMRLYAYVNGDGEPTTYPLGVGREGLETPIGTTTVTRKAENPTWRPTPRMRSEDPDLPAAIPPGPDNPMGTHALYLGWPAYAIHGTNRPYGIGRRISSGCIRMYPEDVIKFYESIAVGTKVTVVDQPIKVAWIDDRLYIEAHPNLEQSIEMEETARITAPKLADKDMDRIIKVAGEYKDRIRWAAVRTAVRERRGYPVEIARRSGSVAQDDKTVVRDISSPALRKAAEKAEVEEVKKAAKEELEEIYKQEEAQQAEAPARTRQDQYRAYNP